MIFDARSHVLDMAQDVNENVCGRDYCDLTDVQFSEDNPHILAKLECGFDDEKSVVFFDRLP